MESIIYINSDQSVKQQNQLPSNNSELWVEADEKQTEKRKEENDNDEGYQVVKRRRSRAPPEIGNNPEGQNFGFVGCAHKKEKKIWIFIKYVSDSTTSENVSDFIASKTNSDGTKIQIKEVETYHNVANNKCFLIGLDPSLKDKVYDHSFWPRGVTFERFNFIKGQRFLDKNVQQDEHRPRDFHK
nr:unnamed protein product [Callosobruchus analis]